MKKLLSFIIVSLVLVNGADLHIDLMSSFLKTNYKEYQNSSIIDSESSKYLDMAGIRLDIYKYFVNENRIIFGIEYSQGETTYNGSTWDGKPLTLQEKNSYIFNSRIIYEAFLKTYEFTSYIEKMYFDLGVGYRYWDRGKSDYAGDYDERYKWPYFIVGFSDNEIFSKFDYGINFFYHRAVLPKMDADLGGGTTFDLGKTDGYRFELPIRYHLATNYGITFKYTYDYWKIGKSDTQNVTFSDGKYVVHEPDSKTKNQYLNLGIYLNF
jgi:hypothetical protein